VHYTNPTFNLRSVRFQSFGEPLVERPFSEAEEMELALELLEVSSEAELEQFLGDLVKKAWRGIKKVGAGVIRPLGGLLKTVAKTALPLAATAAGSFFGGPVGGAIAGKLGALVSQALEAEASAMAASDRDFEKCRQFVRMAGIAAKAAALAPPGQNPIAVAQKVLADAAKEKLGTQATVAANAGSATRTARSALAPTTASLGSAARRSSREPQTRANRRSCPRCGQPTSVCSCGVGNQSGRWVRHGRSIVIVNC
jgi:hypothetical protein